MAVITVGALYLSVSRARVYRRIMLKRSIERPPEHLYPADEWRIVETRYSGEFVGPTGTVFSLGNGFVGARAASKGPARRWSLGHFPSRRALDARRAWS